MMRYALLIDEDNWRAEAIASGLKSHLEATEIIVVSTPVQAMTYIDDHEQLPSVIVAKATFNRSTTIINLLNELQSYIDTAAIPVVLYMQQPQQLPTEIRPFYHITEVLDEQTMTPQQLARAAALAQQQATQWLAQSPYGRVGNIQDSGGTHVEEAAGADHE